jgi:hypothetical protein
MPTQSDSISATEIKATATPDSIHPDCLSETQKGTRRATSTTGLEDCTGPDTQENVASSHLDEATSSLQGENGTPSAYVNPNPLPTVRSTPPVKDLRFSTLDGRIVPPGNRTTLRAQCDHFTDFERLTLYTRFRALATELCHQGVYTPNAEQWLGLWEKVAYVLPGRSPMKCIEFYMENEEHFWF